MRRRCSACPNLSTPRVGVTNQPEMIIEVVRCKQTDWFLPHPLLIDFFWLFEKISKKNLIDVVDNNSMLVHSVTTHWLGKRAIRPSEAKSLPRIFRWFGRRHRNLGTPFPKEWSQ